MRTKLRRVRALMDIRDGGSAISAASEVLIDGLPLWGLPRLAAVHIQLLSPPTSVPSWQRTRASRMGALIAASSAPEVMS